MRARPARGDEDATDTAFADPEMGEPFLLTPGPLTTAAEVKHAMLRDWGSWMRFRAMTARLRAASSRCWARGPRV